MKRIFLIALMAPTLAFAAPPQSLEDHRDCIALLNDAYRLQESVERHSASFERSSKAGNLTDPYASVAAVERAIKAYLDSLSAACEDLR